MIKFVTGANGYIGRYVVSELLKAGYKVRAFVKEGTDLSPLKGKKCEIIEGDILSIRSLIKAMKGCDTVIHLAAIVGSPDPELNRIINYKGTENVIDACKKNKIKRIIYTSSISAIRKKLGPYGQTKSDSEKIIIKSGIKYTILRPTLVYGKESQGIKRIIENIKRFPLIIPMIGRGEYFTQPVYVKDVAKIITKCINRKASFNKIYNLGGRERIKFIELVKIISKIIGIKKVIVPVPLFLCRLMGYFFQLFPSPIYTVEHVRSLSEDTIIDITPLKNDIDFKPTQLKIGLKEAINEIK